MLYTPLSLPLVLIFKLQYNPQTGLVELIVQNVYVFTDF
jgi:hypothetical protein